MLESEEVIKNANADETFEQEQQFSLLKHVGFAGFINQMRNFQH